MSELRKQTRVEQTLSEVERFQNEFDCWKERRDKADEKQQNQRQLTALATVVTKALTDISEDVGQILFRQLVYQFLCARSLEVKAHVQRPLRLKGKPPIRRR